jgi:8-oxo-dGTP pyrophosphatase MutT (NUDIX family)
VNADTHRAQYAALPFRRRGKIIEVLLITSRETRRWIIPKGWPAEGLSPREAAAREAYEEAGLVGRMSEQAIGRFHYDKRLAEGSSVSCAVEVFALEVEDQMPTWLEQDERETRWFALKEAAEAVQEPELQALIRSLPSTLAA